MNKGQFRYGLWHVQASGEDRVTETQKESNNSDLGSYIDGASGKEPAYQCRRLKKSGFNPWVKKIPWRSAWQPTPVFLPEKSLGQRSLVGYSPWSHKESDTTEQLLLSLEKFNFI